MFSPVLDFYAGQAIPAPSPEQPPPAPPPDEALYWKVLRVANIYTIPVAAALSYQRNQSIGTAIIHGLIPLPYLVYRGIQKLQT